MRTSPARPGRWSSLGRAREVLAQEDAVISGALAAGVFPAADLGQVVQLIGAQRYLFALTLPDLNLTDRVEFEALAAPTPFTALVALENRGGRPRPAPGAPPPVDASSWRAAYDRVAADLQGLELRAADRLVDRGGRRRWFIFGQIVVAGLLGLVTVAGHSGGLGPDRPQPDPAAWPACARPRSSWPSTGCPGWWTGCATARRSTSTHEAPPLPYGDDEIGQVGHAFNELQRTAVNSAVEEANAAPRPQRGLPQHRPPQPDPAAPAAVHAWTGWSGGPTTRPSSRTCSGSTTSPPGCAATPRTWSSSPAPPRAAAGATRSRWSTCCAARSPRSRTTPGSASGRCPRWPSPAARSATSSTCSPS